MLKPFSQACENNKTPIAQVLQRIFAGCSRVLEIGSGTGQHAVHMAAALPHLVWQTSDRADNLPGIRLWLDEAARPNLPAPIELDVLDTWPEVEFDAVFSANTAHIMPWHAVERMFSEVGSRLPRDGLFALYGPFNYHGRYTSDSNRKFDAYLKQAVAHQGIRDVDDIDALARRAGLNHLEDNAMPANNRVLVWKKHDRVLSAIRPGA